MIQEPASQLTRDEQLILDLNGRGFTQRQIRVRLRIGDNKTRRILCSLEARGYSVFGRKGSQKPERARELVELLKSGMSLRSAAAKLGASCKTAQEWRALAIKMGLHVPKHQNHPNNGALEKMRLDLKKLGTRNIDWSNLPRFEDVKLRKR